MPKVAFIDHLGARYEVDAPLGKTLMQVALDNSVPGILGECGGACSCGTCHAYVAPAFLGLLAERNETELAMLEGVPEPRANSRLCCQIRIRPELDGLEAELPREQA